VTDDYGEDFASGDSFPTVDDDNQSRISENVRSTLSTHASLSTHQSYAVLVSSLTVFSRLLRVQR
jgi:hypothetical protein